MSAEMEGIYRVGQAQEDVRLGRDSRPFDRAIGGVVALLQSVGIPATYKEVGWAWHDPLAGVSDHMSALDVLRWMDGVLLRHLQRDQFELEHVSRPHWIFDRIYDLMQFDPSAEVARLVDSEIKRVYPKVRRGTRKYRELAASVQDQATKVVLDARRKEVKRRVGELNQGFKEDGEKAKQALERAAFIDARATEVERLLGSAPGVSAAREAAQAYRQAAVHLEEELNRYRKLATEVLASVGG